MRKVVDLQMESWKKDIADIEFDLQSRDEIPKLLMGLQHIYGTREIREQVFDILSRIVPRKKRKTGRPGMDLWKILVLGSLRINCNFDFDKLQELANNHRTLRLMLGHAETDIDSRYALQTMQDNITLLTPELLDEINQIVVPVGQDIAIPRKDEDLRGSCDSFVVETDVHYPTDTNLLYDAMRKMINLIAVICSEIGITQWRQSHHNILKVKRLLRNLQNLRPSTSKDPDKKAQRESVIVGAHEHYIQVCAGLVSKVTATIRILRELDLLSATQDVRLTVAWIMVCRGSSDMLP